MFNNRIEVANEGINVPSIQAVILNGEIKENYMRKLVYQGELPCVTINTANVRGMMDSKSTYTTVSEKEYELLKRVKGHCEGLDRGEKCVFILNGKLVVESGKANVKVIIF